MCNVSITLDYHRYTFNVSASPVFGLSKYVREVHLRASSQAKSPQLARAFRTINLMAKMLNNFVALTNDVDDDGLLAADYEFSGRQLAFINARKSRGRITTGGAFIIEGRHN